MSVAAGGEAARAGSVYLVGAGPGDVRLLTLRAARLLDTATLILPDDLVTEEVLAMAHAGATITPVGKRCGRAGITQAGIHALMIDAARAGESVVRLKSGDPLIFGRAGEEIAALRGAGIAFEIVPGITAAFAAAARLGTPLTDRTSASKLILATAHHAANKVDLDPRPEPLWSGSLPPDATLVIYMPGRDFERLAADLVRSGIAPETPCVAISHAARQTEQVHRSTLAGFRNHAVGPAPVLVLVGEAIRSSRYPWSEPEQDREANCPDGGLGARHAKGLL